MMHLIKDGQPLADCPYCDEPLHLAPITTDFAGGMHTNCYEKYGKDLEMIDVEKVYDGHGMDHPDADLIVTSIGLSDRDGEEYVESIALTLEQADRLIDKLAGFVARERANRRENLREIRTGS
jgi:hypothetical protein